MATTRLLAPANHPEGRIPLSDSPVGKIQQRGNCDRVTGRCQDQALSRVVVESRGFSAATDGVVSNAGKLISCRPFVGIEHQTIPATRSVIVQAMDQSDALLIS